MTVKLKINPALVAALEHYAGGRYNPNQPTLFVHYDEKGHQSHWPLERACWIAAEVLDCEDLNFLKFKALKDGLKELGMDKLYERIMREPIDAP